MIRVTDTAGFDATIIEALANVLGPGAVCRVYDPALDQRPASARARRPMTHAPVLQRLAPSTMIAEFAIDLAHLRATGKIPMPSGLVGIGCVVRFFDAGGRCHAHAWIPGFIPPAVEIATCYG